MKIQDLYGAPSPRKPDKQSSLNDIYERKTDRKLDKPPIILMKSDQVEISPEAQKLNQSYDEIGLARELLSKLPQARLDLIQEAQAKIKTGSYSSEKMVESAAKKLLESGELKGLL